MATAIRKVGGKRLIAQKCGHLMPVQLEPVTAPVVLNDYKSLYFLSKSTSKNCQLYSYQRNIKFMLSFQILKYYFVHLF